MSSTSSESRSSPAPHFGITPPKHHAQVRGVAFRWTWTLEVVWVVIWAQIRFALHWIVLQTTRRAIGLTDYVLGRRGKKTSPLYFVNCTCKGFILGEERIQTMQRLTLLGSLKRRCSLQRVQLIKLHVHALFLIESPVVQTNNIFYLSPPAVDSY